jgi:hypothetical protein
MIGGVLGGLLLIVLVIIAIYFHRRRATDANQKAGDARNVVAFENPMY